MKMSEKHLTLLIGPAKYPEDDRRMVSMFLEEPGKKIICGSSAANMVSGILSLRQETPDADAVPGLCLITDGTLILSQVLEILSGSHESQEPPATRDAKILATSLLEAESLSFLIGMAVNKSQRSLSLPAKTVVKSRFARELVDLLKEKGKKVMVEYF